jgi:putative transposase
MDSPHMRRQWDHPKETTGPIKRQRLNRLSPSERAKLNRRPKDVVEDGLFRPSHIELYSQILLVPKCDGSLRLCIDYRELDEVIRKDACPLPRVDDTLDELKHSNLLTHLDLASGFWQVRVREEDVHMATLRTPDGLLEWAALPFGRIRSNG